MCTGGAPHPGAPTGGSRIWGHLEVRVLLGLAEQADLPGASNWPSLKMSGEIQVRLKIELPAARPKGLTGSGASGPVAPETPAWLCWRASRREGCTDVPGGVTCHLVPGGRPAARFPRVPATRERETVAE